MGYMDFKVRCSYLPKSSFSPECKKVNIAFIWIPITHVIRYPFLLIRALLFQHWHLCLLRENTSRTFYFIVKTTDGVPPVPCEAILVFILFLHTFTPPLSLPSLMHYWAIIHFNLMFETMQLQYNHFLPSCSSYTSHFSASVQANLLS